MQVLIRKPREGDESFSASLFTGAEFLTEEPKEYGGGHSDFAIFLFSLYVDHKFCIWRK